MSKAKLIVNNQREVTIEDQIVAVGRASDNTIPLLNDSNVSRYHIEIESRGAEFWLVELGSSNGTTVNDEKIYDEIKLNAGDVILLGGTSEILFDLEQGETAGQEMPDAAASVSAAPEAPLSAANVAPNVSVPNVSAPPVPAAPALPIAADAAKASKMPVLLAVAGIVCLLALICVVVAVAISFSGGSGGGKCAAKIKVTSPENGDTIKKETDIEIETEDEADCAKKAILLMDGEEFASTEEKPFKATLNPAEFAALSDGDNHSLQIAFEDEKSEKIVQPEEVQLFFETLAKETPTPAPIEKTEDKPPATPTPATTGKKASTAEIEEMSRALLKEFNNVPNYKFDPQFLQAVQIKTGEFAAEGYFAHAQNFNEPVKIGFIQGAGLDAPLGYILAMSRTQMKLPVAGAAEEGLWKIKTELVTANGYNGTCGGESLSDAKQNCAAKASALYMKALLVNVFENDLVYAVSAFGMSTGDASNWKSSLPANRADFWNVIKSPAQRDEIVRFFAAGIVTENPQKFGLKKDAPLGTLYRNYLVK